VRRLAALARNLALLVRIHGPKSALFYTHAPLLESCARVNRVGFVTGGLSVEQGLDSRARRLDDQPSAGAAPETPDDKARPAAAKASAWRRRSSR
jgi:hypothetical protein